MKITLNIQNIDPSTVTQTLSDIESDQKALEEATKSLFEKIASVENGPTQPTKETTKNIFEKIAASQDPEKVSMQSTTEEALEEARLAKVEQKRLEVQKREQEALAKKKAEAEKKAHLEKVEQERVDAIAMAAAKEKARLARVEQRKLKREKKKQKALAKKRREKQAKIKKQKLAKAKAQKAKQRRDKLLAKKNRLQQAKKRRATQKATKRKSNDPLANAIMNASTSMSPARSKQPAMRMIKQFYGSEFNTFTKTQKRFIEKNLGSIYKITQRTLTRNGYPWVAQKTRQQGTAIVTFYLHPNGRISGLRLKRRIGYAALDKNTLKVIRIAYKDYPRPKTKTKITFYVEYSLF